MDKQSISYLSKSFAFFSVILLLLASFKATAAADFVLPPNHQSTYTIKKYGTKVGEIHNELKQSNGTATFTSKASASGFASFFSKDKITEVSTFNYPEDDIQGTLKQQSYRLQHSKKKKKNQDITFKHTSSGKLNIAGTYKHKNYQLKSEKAVWARQLLPLLMSQDLQLNNKTASNRFSITDKGSLQNYTYTLEKTENLRILGKVHAALKFKINREGSNRMSYVWLASTYHYLPLKIEQYKGDKLSASMFLKKFKTT